LFNFLTEAVLSLNISKYTGESVGLFGMDEVFRLCHLPFLTFNDVFGVIALEGSSGTGKTTAIQRIGILNHLATGGKYGIYSADKVRYEDFIGCPIPDPETLLALGATIVLAIPGLSGAEKEEAEARLNNIIEAFRKMRADAMPAESTVTDGDNLGFMTRKMRKEMWNSEIRGTIREFHAMPYGEYYIWGATAGMLINLYEVLNT